MLEKCFWGSGKSWNFWSHIHSIVSVLFPTWLHHLHPHSPLKSQSLVIPVINKNAQFQKYSRSANKNAYHIHIVIDHYEEKEFTCAKFLLHRHRYNSIPHSCHCCPVLLLYVHYCTCRNTVQLSPFPYNHCHIAIISCYCVILCCPEYYSTFIVLCVILHNTLSIKCIWFDHRNIYH